MSFMQSVKGNKKLCDKTNFFLNILCRSRLKMSYLSKKVYEIIYVREKSNMKLIIRLSGQARLSSPSEIKSWHIHLILIITFCECSRVTFHENKNKWQPHTDSFVSSEKWLKIYIYLFVSLFQTYENVKRHESYFLKKRWEALCPECCPVYIYFPPSGAFKGPLRNKKGKAAGFDKNDNMGSRPESTGHRQAGRVTPGPGARITRAPAPALSESAAAWPRPGPGRSYDSYHGHQG